jgi:hypothetical protein
MGSPHEELSHHQLVKQAQRLFLLLLPIIIFLTGTFPDVKEKFCDKFFLDKRNRISLNGPELQFGKGKIDSNDGTSILADLLLLLFPERW